MGATHWEAFMGFASTAVYFEARAKKERDADQQRRLLEVAGFYRTLAGIAPDFPSGYQPNGKGSSSGRWRARAEECRTIAAQFDDLQHREQLLRLAVGYER